MRKNNHFTNLLFQSKGAALLLGALLGICSSAYAQTPISYDGAAPAYDAEKPTTGVPSSSSGAIPPSTGLRPLTGTPPAIPGTAPGTVQNGNNGCGCQQGCSNCSGGLCGHSLLSGSRCCNEERLFGLPTLNSLLGECNDTGIEIGGWSQYGYHSQGNGLFNSHDGDLNLHQQWLYIEKKANGHRNGCSVLDFGFRVDMMYGVDAGDTQSFGNTPGEWDFANGMDHGIYGFAFPQLYGEVAMGNLSVKVGHFYTIMGYEVVTAPDNFFYSHAYTMYNSEPFTHTGALATYETENGLTLWAGWTLGWDTGFDKFRDGGSFLGGFSAPLSDDMTFTYTTSIGDFGARGEGYAHSIVVDTQVTDKLNYVVQSDLVSTNGGGDHQYGLNQYMLYHVSDCLAFGSRAEWWKNGNNSQYALTTGMNFKPYSNFIVRPEVRHDWNPGNGRNFTTIGTDFIWTY